MNLRISLLLVFLFFFADPGWAGERAEEWFIKGIGAAEEGDYAEAIRCFKTTIDLYPDHVPSYTNIGYIYAMKGMWDEAIESYQKALTISPNDARLYQDLGFCWYKKGMFDDAVAALKKAIDLDVAFATAYQSIGLVYAEKKMFDEAIEAFKEALKIEPDDPSTHFHLGHAYKALGNNIFAADHYYQAGILYLNKHHREGALTAYENILPCSEEVAGILLKKLYPDTEASDLALLSSPQKKAQWHVLLTKMNIREDPSIHSKTIGQLEKDAAFQIVREGPNNTSPCCWYLIQTKSGFRGWLCGVYKGIAKYNTLSKDTAPSLAPPAGQ